MEYLVTGAFCERFDTKAEAEEYLGKLRELAANHPRIQEKLGLFETKIIELPSCAHLHTATAARTDGGLRTTCQDCGHIEDYPPIDGSRVFGRRE